jgi:hypothetical protein
LDPGQPTVREVAVKASVLISPLVLLLVGLLVLSLLGDLGRRDLDRSRALAEAALQRALEDP